MNEDMRRDFIKRVVYGYDNGAYVKELVGKGYRVDEITDEGCPVFVLAAAYGFSNVVRAMIDGDVKVNDPCTGTPHAMITKSNSNRDNMINFANIIASGSTSGQTALMAAAVMGHDNIVSMLIMKNASITAQDNYGRTPLMYAAIGGHIEIVKMIINVILKMDDRAILNMIDKDNKTAMAYAIEAGMQGIPLIVRMLYEAGGKV